MIPKACAKVKNMKEAKLPPNPHPLTAHKLFTLTETSFIVMSIILPTTMMKSNKFHLSTK